MTPPLTESIRAILEEVRLVTGKEVEFIQKFDLPSYAIVKAARRSMPHHLVLYRTDRGDINNHLIAHECGHILRMFRVPVEKRLTPRSTLEMKEAPRREFSTELYDLFRQFGEEKFIQLSNIWYDGLIQQLTNMAPDIMVERWMHGGYPALWDDQKRSLDRQAEDAAKGMSSSVRKMAPRKVWEASNIMNYAFFKLLDKYLKTDYFKTYKGTKFTQKGDQLVEITDTTYAEGYEGDIQMVNEWAKFLGLTEWFEWGGFEEVPEGYSLK